MPASAATPPSAHYEATTATYANPVVLDWIIDVDMQDHDSGELVTQSFLLDSGSSNFAVAVADCVSCPSKTAEYKLVTLGAADDPKVARGEVAALPRCHVPGWPMPIPPKHTLQTTSILY